MLLLSKIKIGLLGEIRYEAGTEVEEIDQEAE
jgi:hypothetical protein